MIDVHIIITLICSTIGLILGFIIRMYYEKRIYHHKKHDEIIIDYDLINNDNIL